jgi:hypothetical protein
MKDDSAERYEQPMRCGAKPCHSSMKRLPDVTSRTYSSLISVVAPDSLSTWLSRLGRDFRLSSSICPMLTLVIIDHGPTSLWARLKPRRQQSRCGHLFHELPPKVRGSKLRECARVLKPGGRLILLHSLQRDDQPDYAGPASAKRIHSDHHAVPEVKSLH